MKGVFIRNEEIGVIIRGLLLLHNYEHAELLFKKTKGKLDFGENLWTFSGSETGKRILRNNKRRKL
jgi:hypothetical protein